VTPYAPSVPTRECGCAEWRAWGWRAHPKCPDCLGTGHILALRMGDVLCPACEGTGTQTEPGRHWRTFPCLVCEGRGLIQEAE
jgi:DnaJ-class molecular chaperone